MYIHKATKYVNKSHKFVRINSAVANKKPYWEKRHKVSAIKLDKILLHNECKSRAKKVFSSRLSFIDVALRFQQLRRL